MVSKLFTDVNIQPGSEDITNLILGGLYFNTGKVGLIFGYVFTMFVSKIFDMDVESTKIVTIVTLCRTWVEFQEKPKYGNFGQN